jgi:hypothetical protein
MKAILAACVMLSCVSARADDMQKYLNDTQTLVRQGKYPEALDRFVWFHENAVAHQPSMSGVRLSFALSYWKALGEKYPPAKDALLEMRDRTTRQVLDSGATAELFHDVAALNRTLGEDRKTVDLFLVVDKNTPELAKKSWFMVKDAVIGAKQYELAAKYIGDPEMAFLNIRQGYERNVVLYKDPRFGGAHFKAFNEKNLVKESLQLISVLQAVNQRDQAVTVRDSALKLLDDPRLRAAVPERPPAESKS